MKKHLLLTLLFFSFIFAKAQINDTTFKQIDTLKSVSIDTLKVIIDSSIAEKKIDTAIVKPTTIATQNNTTLKKIEGIVKDFTTNEPLSFATVFFPHSSLGTRTDIDGKFTISAKSFPNDTLQVSIIGYAKKNIIIDKNASYQKFNLDIERASITMKEMVFTFDRNPGLTLVKKVIEHKPFNNYDKAKNYSYEVYNKMELDINKIPKKAFSKAPLIKKFSFVQNYIDSTSEDKPFLPLFLTESISDYYYQTKPKKTKEIIKGTRISGYKNESVSQMLGSMYQNINIYENSISIFNTPFISPIANDAGSYYKYNIVDTQLIDNRQCFKVIFTAKRNGEHTFDGEFWVHDTDYAIQKMNMIVTKDKNVNWVNRVTLLQEFTCLEDTIWFLTKDKYYVDFLPPQGEKIAGFLGRKSTTYKNIVVNNQHIEDIINDKKNKDNTLVQEGATDRNEDYWNTVRHDSLTKNEKTIYHMIDTIQNLPIYKKYYNGINLLSTGIIEAGPFQIGSFYNIYSSNTIEGPRFKFTLGTTPQLFKNVYLRAYVAYGTKDERFKYYGSALWVIGRKPRMYLFAEYKHDLENNISVFDGARAIDNIFSSVGRKKNIPWKLAFVDRQRFEFFNSHYNGLSYQVSFERKAFTPYSPLPSTEIFIDKDEKPSNTVHSTEIGLEIKHTYKEEFVEGNYYRTSLGSKYPTLKLYVGHGFKNLLGGSYDYTKLRFSIADNQPLHRFGSLYYQVFAGRIFGTVPYSLLEVHQGNEFYYYNSHAFNMMYRYEFISDKYLGAIVEHNMGSLFFKYIPLVEKMKLRTFWNAKTVYGDLGPQNSALNLDKGYTFQTLRKSPYLELGTGIENIFKIIRVDVVWRVLPYRIINDSQTRRFGVFGSMKLTF